MDVLVRLCTSAGETVAAEQLLTEIWRGTFYGDNPVHKAIAQIRRALGDTSTMPRYIETVRKRGYRVLVPVLIETPGGAQKGAGVAAWTDGSPFRGLEPFDVAHEAVYFGRGETLARVLAAVRQQRETGRSLVLVVGQSGSGKTSLLQAGVVPMLLRGCDGLRATSWARCDPGAGRGEHLLDTMAHAMLHWSIGDRPVFLPSERADLAAQLASHPATVGARITAAVERAPVSRVDAGARPQLILVLDPLEAVLAGAVVDRAAVAQLDATVAVLGNHPSVLLLCACRADVYPALLTLLPSLMRLKGGAGHVDLPTLGEGELALCVREPARAAALRFERHPLTQEQLDDRLIEDAQRAPEMLPLLQHVLDRLYARRAPDGALTFAAYQEIGGLNGAIAVHADLAIATLDAPARAALDDVLACVATVSAETGALVVRRASWSVLATAPAERLVQALVDARLFVSGLSEGERHFGVAHEALLRHWPRATAWVERNRNWLQVHARVRLAARRWEEELRRPDLLLRSRRLATEAASLAKRAPGRLTALEHEYAAASLRAVQRTRLMVLTAASLIIVLALASASLAVRERLAREEADLRRAQSDGLLDFALGDLADRLRPIGRLEVLGSVAQEVLLTLAVAPPAADPETALRHVRALRTSAEVLVAQGELADAARALGQAQGALSMDGLSDALRFERSQVAYWEGLVAFRQKRLDAAQLHWRAYADDANALRQADPGNPAWILEASYALNNLGTVAKARGDYPAAAGAFRDSVALKRDYLARMPAAVDVYAELADSVSWLADALDRSGRPRDAIPLMHEQETMLSDARAKAPGDRRIAHQHALALIRTGLLHAGMSESDAAAARLRAGADALSALALGDPSNRTWSRDAAHAQAQLGWLLAAIGHEEEGRQRLRQARDLLEPLVANGTPPAEWRRLHAMTELRSAVLEASDAPPETTGSAIAQALAQLQALADEASGDADSRAALAHGLLAQGDWFATLGEQDRANSRWRAAVATVAATSRPDAPDRAAVETLALALSRLHDPDHRRWRDALRVAGHAHPAYTADIIPHYLQRARP